MKNSEFEFFKKKWEEKIRQIKESGSLLKKNDKALIAVDFRTERRTLERHMTEQELNKRRPEFESLHSDLNVALATTVPAKTVEKTAVSAMALGFGVGVSREKEITSKYPQKEKKKPKKRAYI
jgi:hypothetical protein